MHRSIFDRFVADPRDSEVKASRQDPSDRLLTPANIVTAARPILGSIATKKLIKGERGVFKYVMGVGVSDGIDGWLSRAIDRRWPNSGMGTTKIGAPGDTVADVATVLPIGLGTLAAGRVPLSAKLGLGAVLAQESTKLNWARKANSDYKQAGGEGQLYIQPTKGGKEAMAEKFSCLGLAALASEFENPVVQGVIGAAALYFGVTGALRGNEAVGQYTSEAAALTRDLQTSQDAQNIFPTSN